MSVLITPLKRNMGFNYDEMELPSDSKKCHNIPSLLANLVECATKLRFVGIKNQTFCSLVGFNQGLSASQQCFPLTTNQHQPDLLAQKPTSEQAQKQELAEFQYIDQ